jgi:nucleoside-diphosphate-sugar epimerase
MISPNSNLVTGGTGFIGAQAVRYLVNEGKKVLLCINVIKHIYMSE